MAAASMKCAPTAILLLGTALAAAGCYHAHPLDEGVLLSDLRHPPEPAGPAGAPPAESDGKPPLGAVATEDQAVTLALEHNPELRAFRRRRQVAEGGIVAAAAIPNPALKLEALHLQEWGNAGPGFGVGFQWSPPQPVERSARKRQAEARLQEVRQEIFEREWQLATEVRAACALLRELQEQGRLLEGAVTRRQRIIELVHKRIQLGASTRLDLNLVSLALTQVERERDDVEAQRVVAVRALQALVGAPDATVALQASPADQDAPATPPDGRALEDQALAARPALRAAKARYLQREQAVRREYAQRLPWFQLSAAPRYRFNPSSNKYDHDLYLGVEVTLPIFNWNTGGIRVAEAERREEREKMVALLSHLRRDIGMAQARLEVHRAALVRFRERVLPALAEHERLLEVTMRGGQVDLVTLLTAEDVVLRHRRAYAALLLQHRTAWLALERAVGARVFAPGR